MRKLIAAAVLVAAALLTGACATANDTSLTTAPASTAAPAPTRAPSKVVAVDAAPVNGAQSAEEAGDQPDAAPSDTAEQATAAGNRLAVGTISIAVPDTWVPVSDQAALNDIVRAGRQSTVPDAIDEATLAGWSSLIAEDDVRLAIDPTTGHSASLVVSPRLGGLSPNDDPAGWVTAMEDLTAGTIAGSTYAGAASTAGGHKGVRSTIMTPLENPSQPVDQFTTLVGEQLVTITVSPSSTSADEIFTSLLAP